MTNHLEHLETLGQDRERLLGELSGVREAMREGAPTAIEEYGPGRVARALGISYQGLMAMLKPNEEE